MSLGLLEAAAYLALGLGLACVLTAVVLVLLRATRGMRDRRAERRRARARTAMLELLMGEPDEATRARDDLLAGRAGSPRLVEREGFSMLTKVRGDSADELRALLHETGAEARAVHLARSRSAVRRCRGAHRLGVLHAGGQRALLEHLLSDPVLSVRRMAVRALGGIGDPAATPALLRMVDEERRLRRDLVFAVTRIGVGAVPALRAEAETGLARQHGHDAATEFALLMLGQLGDVESVPRLLVALFRPAPGLAAVAAGSLGEIGAPEAVAPLLAALGHPEPAVRSAAATALGRIGDPVAAPGLGAAFVPEDRLLNRAVADALLRLGGPGLDELAGSASPYAVEALALGALRGVS